MNTAEETSETFSKIHEVYTSTCVEEIQFDWEVGVESLGKLTSVSLLDNDGSLTNMNTAVQMQPRFWVPSPSFQVGERIGSLSEWCAQLTCSVGDNGHQHNMSIYLCLMQFLQQDNKVDRSPADMHGVQCVDAIYKFEVFERGQLLMSKGSSIRRFRDSEEGCIWGWVRFLPFSKLVTPIGTGGPITIRINLILLQKSYDPYDPCGEFVTDSSSDEQPKTSRSDSSVSSLPSQKRPEPMEVESQPLKETKVLFANGSPNVEAETTTVKFKTWIAGLWENKQGWDTEVMSRDKVFRTHANILSARSTFFSRVFAIETSGAKKEFIVNDEIDPLIAEAVLEHCYTGHINLPKTFENYMNLYKAAYQFEMRVLKDEIFLEISSPDNLTSPVLATRLLTLVKEYPPELSSLKYLADYVADNLDTLKKVPEFSDFKDDDVQNNDGQFFVKLFFEV